jgi:hypothetical protein
MLGPNATSSLLHPRNSAARSRACTISASVRREVSYGAPVFAFDSRKYPAIASITSSGHCVPPGPSKKASGRWSALNRTRTASTSSAAVVLTRRA